MKHFPVYMLIMMITTCLVTGCNSKKKEILLDSKAFIHHDDFDYSVDSFAKVKFISNGIDTFYTDGWLYVVDFRVDNKALKVGHKWDSSIAYMTDADGNEYECLKNYKGMLLPEQAAGLKEQYDTPPQFSESAILVFELPENAVQPGLKVRGYTLAGDVADGGKFRREKILLEK